MTKLTKAEKAELTLDKREYPHIKFFSFPSRRVTVAIAQTGNEKAKITWAIQAKDEDKFRKSVGEKMCFDRFYVNICLPIETAECETLRETAERFADNLTWLD